MGNLGLVEVVVVVVLALLVFGPSRLPEVARDSARFLRRFREEASRSLDELKRAADLDDLDDLRRVRDEVSGAAADVRGALRGKPVSRGGPAEATAAAGLAARPADDAPPVDLEAT